MIECLKSDFRVVRLAEGDAICETDHLRDFRNLILANETMYPKIGAWLKKKVVPGLKNSERVALVGYLNGNPVVSAVAKRGADAKICHLRVDESLHSAHLGEVFFSLLAFELRNHAKSVHFTLPESLWAEKGGFFNSFGFGSAAVNDVQYRLFDQELRCQTPFSKFWHAVVEKVPRISQLYSFGGFSLDNSIVLSIKPEFAERILEGKKTIELRRRFSTRWSGHRVNLYASGPVRSLVGEATIKRVHSGDRDEIWERFHKFMGCTRVQFDEYTKGTAEIFAIELDDVQPYRERLPLVQASHWIDEELVPPQSYLTLERNRAWSAAVSLAAYLHGCFRGRSRVTSGVERNMFQMRSAENVRRSCPESKQMKLFL